MKFYFFVLLCLTLSTVACQGRKTADAEFKRGHHLYSVHCMACHGLKGDGQGEVAKYLWPKPRDLTAGVFKYRTTRGPIPSDNDLLQTIKVGIPGTSMPGWDMLGTKDWQAILKYLKSLSPRLQKGVAGARIEVPELLPKSAEAIHAGQAIYRSSGCVSCHGVGGQGDGPASPRLKDFGGDPITPRDFTRGPLKWGNSDNEIYRTLMMGIAGTPMPGYEQTLTSEQIWQLVHYIKSLQKNVPEGFDPSKPQRYLIKVAKVSGNVPLDFKSEEWAQTKAVPIFLNQSWTNKTSAEWLTIKALHNDIEIAFYLSWEDDQSNVKPNASDAIAMQFPLKKISDPSELPFVGMGNSKNPVHIWEWKPSGVLEWNAEGVGTQKVQEASSTQVIAQGIYEEGHWHIILKRSLARGEKQDTHFDPVGYLSLSLWDADLPRFAEPKSFSEWMIYEIQN